MRFSGSEAWQEAQQTVTRNREIFLALAGVFYLLPSLLVTLLFPQPEPQQGLTPEATLALVLDFWKGAFPAYFALGLFQTVGTLAILRLCADLSRPTVGEAIRVGLSGILTYLGAQLLIGVAFGIGGGVPLALAGASGSGPLIVLVAIALVVGLIYVLVRTGLLAPVIAVDAERNPIAALRRSWELTSGNVGAIFLFFLLLGLAFGIVLLVAMVVVGIVLALVAGAETAKLLAAAVSTLLTSVMSLYFIAALASVHRQLSATAATGLGATFE